MGAPRADQGAIPRPGILDCRNGAEPIWAKTYGSIDAFNGCMGTIDFSFGHLMVSTGASGGHVTGIGTSLPPGADRLECGPGCALGDEETLVLSEAEKIVTIVHDGHDQWKFGWYWSAPPAGEPGAPGYWAPEPYLLMDLVGLESDGVGGERPIQQTADAVNLFAQATGWMLVDRSGGYTLFRPDGPVWRVAEKADPLAAMEKKAAGPSGPMFPPRGKFIEYHRTGGRLDEIRDYRYPAIRSRVFGRNASQQIDSIKVDVNGAGESKDEIVYQYDGTGRIREFQHFGATPTQVKYKPGAGPPYLVEEITAPDASIVKYEYRADGRLAKVTDLAAPTKTPAEDTGYSFTYFACGGGALADAAATFPYTNRPFACSVLEVDEDGYGRGTEFTKFGASAPNVRSYRSRSWAQSNGTPVPGNEEVALRNAAGYLLGTRLTTQGTTERYRPSDGRLAGKCVGVRKGGPNDNAPLDANLAPSAGATGVPANTVAFSIYCYDHDNMLVREVTASGQTVTEYQKAGHPPSDTTFWNNFAWAAQMPRRVTETYRDAAGVQVSRDSLQMIELGAGSSGNPAGAFVVHSSKPYGGGTKSTVLDKYLRPRGSIGPGAVQWSTVGYDAEGNVNASNDPTSQIEMSHKYRASGNVDTSSTKVCGVAKTTMATVENSTYRVISENTATTLRPGKPPLVTTTVHTIEAPTGRAARTTVTAPGYVQTTERTFATTGNKVLKETVRTSVDGEERDVSVSEVRFRGYALPTP